MENRDKLTENQALQAKARASPGFDELAHILTKAIALYRNLADVLREEYVHMAQLDTSALAEAAHAKEVLLGEIMAHETLRIKASESFAARLGIAPADATLLKLAAKLRPAEGEVLRNARTVLNLLIAEAKELNAKNSAFAESSLERIEQMKKNALGLNNNGTTENYSNNGVRQPMSEQGGRLLETKA